MKKENLKHLIFPPFFLGESVQCSAEEFPLSLPLVQHRWTKGAAAQERGEQACSSSLQQQQGRTKKGETPQQSATPKYLLLLQLTQQTYDVTPTQSKIIPVYFSVFPEQLMDNKQTFSSYKTVPKDYC